MKLYFSRNIRTTQPTWKEFEILPSLLQHQPSELINNLVGWTISYTYSNKQKLKFWISIIHRCKRARHSLQPIVSKERKGNTTSRIHLLSPKPRVLSILLVAVVHTANAARRAFSYNGDAWSIWSSRRTIFLNMPAFLPPWKDMHEEGALMTFQIFILHTWKMKWRSFWYFPAEVRRKCPHGLKVHLILSIIS